MVNRDVVEAAEKLVKERDKTSKEGKSSSQKRIIQIQNQMKKLMEIGDKKSVDMLHKSLDKQFNKAAKFGVSEWKIEKLDARTPKWSDFPGEARDRMKESKLKWTGGPNQGPTVKAKTPGMEGRNITPTGGARFTTPLGRFTGKKIPPKNLVKKGGTQIKKDFRKGGMFYG